MSEEKQKYEVNGERWPVVIHWRAPSGATGHGEPIGVELAAEWLDNLKAKNDGFTYWIEPPPVNIILAWAMR